MRKLLFLVFLLCVSLASAQNYRFNIAGLNYSSGPVVPASCVPDGQFFFKNVATTGWYQCSGGVYAAIGSSGVATSVPFSGVTPGTNTGALVMGTGGTLLASGTGQIRATGMSIISPGIPAPSPLATSVCPSGQPVFKYLQNVSGDFQDVGSIDLTTGLPTTPTPAAPRGTEVHCWREWHDDSGVAGTAIRNNLVGIEHTMGHGGVANGAALDERAISSRITNADASFQQIHQMIANYNEAQLTLTPHFNGHAGLEDDVSGLRASVGDSRAGNDGSNPSSIAGTSSAVARFTSTASMGGGGVWAAYVAEVTDTGGGSPGASTSFMGLNIKGFINSGGMTTGQWIGINIAAPNVAAPSFSEGLNIANYGTCSVCYDMTLGGVNSAGTPAGWSSATGPFTFGQQAHAAAGYQTDTLGGVKIKASASAGNMLGLFGFTSGSALIGVADAAGTPNRINLPTATGSANGLLQTDGANPQQTSWTLTPSLTTLALTGQFTSTLATGTAPLVIASTTNVANLNASSLGGATFAAPGAIGGGTPAAGTFTTLAANTSATSPLYVTTTNCAGVGTAASPSVASCSAAPAGAFSCATNAGGGGGICRINTTAVTANSNIFVTFTAAAGIRLGVTCNASPSVIAAIPIAAIVAGTSFDINAPTFITNPVCGYYWIVD